jgi:predicted porin
MKKLILTVVFMLFFYHSGFTSPLEDFSQGSIVVDVNRNICTFVGSHFYDISVTAGLGDKWAIQYRQTNYDARYNDNDYVVKSGGANLIYKVNKNFQLYSGYSDTTAHENPGVDLPDKKVAEIGTITSYALDKRTVIFANLGGGRNVTNIEFGLSYQLEPGLEITPTYRHWTVEKVGDSMIKENFRGFNLGFTCRF